ncbi:CPBP family intramembrane metalloprotease domain-containing protein [Streptomyces sp. Ru62]|uniref:CPBP family intramembrane glutamic endopeptidase n=1 Tax=Streptomyces sp. Ru62 TaxID=2080745 RepID=UPI000CDD1DC1|nr:type II CAAX endopeptidase family protein [Streptomyces sp. Ru62]POX58491.1 CPBP family intramembrane metalloprotease domain-containing protein [Streptomyces sp. Ru62]
MTQPQPLLLPHARSPFTEQLAYHRLARLSPRYRWWRPLLGTLVVAVAYMITVVVLMLLLAALGSGMGYPQDDDGWPEFGPVSGTAVDLLCIAVGIPVVLLVVRWIGRRPAGTVSSVTGRLRWRWLLLCVLTALPVVALAMGCTFLLPADGEPESQWVGWPAFGRALAVLVLLVPVQAAAEEYVFRGWLTQTAGAFLRSPWAALLPQAVLFASAHGWGTVWGFADLVVFGVAAGWLTWRTGGLEASIALHTVNNLLAFGVSAAVVDGLTSDETAADASWQLVVFDVLSIALYTAAVAWWLRRRPLDRTAAAPQPPAPLPGYPYGVPVPQQWAGQPGWGPGATGAPPWAGAVGAGPWAGQAGPGADVPLTAPDGAVPPSPTAGRPETGTALPPVSPDAGGDGTDRT